MEFKKINIKVKKKVPYTEGGEKKFKVVEDIYGFNIAHMSYWRSVTQVDEEGKDSLYTILYLSGNPKGITLRISKSDFERQLEEQTKSNPTKLYQALSETDKIDFTRMQNEKEEGGD